MFYRKCKPDLPLDFPSQNVGCRLSKYIIFLENESRLYEDAKKADKGVVNTAFVTTEGDTLSKQTNTDTENKTSDSILTNTSAIKSTNTQSGQHIQSHDEQISGNSNKSTNVRVNTSTIVEDNVIPKSSKRKTTKNVFILEKKLDSIDHKSANYPEPKRVTIKGIDEDSSKEGENQETIVVQSNVTVAEVTSDGSQTETSSGEYSGGSSGEFEYCRGDFDRDASTIDSSQSSSTCKRSLSFGDKSTRRRTSTTQTGRVHFDTRVSKHGRAVILEGSSTNTEEADDEKWRLSLEKFTSKRYGSKRKSETLSRDIRTYYKQQDGLIDSFEENRSFYKSQDELINQYEEIRLELDDAMENAETVKQLRKRASIYAKITFLVNVILLAIKVVAVVMSGSISLISSLVDSAVDLVSGVVIWVTTRAVKRTNRYVYPQGRTKLEPMSIVILSVIMSVASLQIIKESFTKIVGLANGSTNPPVMDGVTIGITSATVVAKLVLFLLCRRVPHPTVQALALDHRNDVLSNFAAIVFGYIGSQEMQAHTHVGGLVYLDPTGAIVISIYIIVNWCITGWDQIKQLVGHTATSEFISKITWICMDHHKKIQLVDTVRAFHFGTNFLVEVDIVLAPDMTVMEAHDIAEPLQQKIEALPNVERAFVHIDYEVEHDPKSEHKVV